ncbi:MAG: TIGR03936 family radical SAM-associated protein [bacterium]|nr:TIGR03936 family radical SAM-associated protein [bacterium]MCX7916522.1 TIGR03936 family radical SAM-associated protein [bacterium]MDW8163464.1 TIGR03936 family radical SAM-associated protein [Candidatus Omnitrophota bacterium]
MKVYKLRIFYRKEGLSRFISHLSFCKLIERSLRRLEIPLNFSKGFTPHPKISYCPPLPIPISGTNEFFEIEVFKIFDLEIFIQNINSILPEGTQIKNCEWIEKKFSLSLLYGLYTIPLLEDIIIEKAEKFGEIVQKEKGFIKVIFKMENFSHKKIFVNGIFDGIIRELFLKNGEI